MVDSVLSGSQINIQATPASQFIHERKQQLAKMTIPSPNVLNDVSQQTVSGGVNTA